MSLGELLLLSDLVRQAGRGKLVHRHSDPWGDILVIDQGEHRVLTFGTIYEQSRLNKRYPALMVHHYIRGMMLSLAFREPKHVTLLGLGSGCLLQGLQAMPAPPRVAVVEHRQAVVDVARDYFWLPEAGNISVNVSDASAYLKRTAAVQATPVMCWARTSSAGISCG
ncbi:MAG: hypothetical protein R6X06_02015, partial [Gammaproteobacteria bacterium]